MNSGGGANLGSRGKNGRWVVGLDGLPCRSPPHRQGIGLCPRWGRHDSGGCRVVPTHTPAVSGESPPAKPLARTGVRGCRHGLAVRASL